MSKENRNKSLVDSIYDFMSSIKLSIIVLIGLAVTSIIGTVLQQGKEPQHYYNTYGETWGSLIQALNLGDMYHSWWFLMLLAMLMANITFCSLKRFPSAWRQIKDVDPVYTERSVALHERLSLELAGAKVDDVAEKAQQLLSEKLGSPVGSVEQDGERYVMFSKGAWSRYGVYITHFSLFLFALGAIIGLLWGFKGYMPIVEGNTEELFYARDVPAIGASENISPASADMEMLRGVVSELSASVASIATGRELYVEGLELSIVDAQGRPDMRTFELPEPSSSADQITSQVMSQLANMKIGAGKSVAGLSLVADRFRRKLDFQIRLDRFALEMYPDSQRPKDYVSNLVVIENGQEVQAERIEVNSPLIRDGIFFYQSSYGQVGVKSVKVTVAGPDRKILHSGADLGRNRALKLLDGEELYIRDMWRDQQGRLPDGVILGISKDGAPTSVSSRTFEPYVGRDWWPVGKYQVRLDKANWWYYTGLQVAKDPGVPTVWAGCILITIGLIVSFFMSHRRVWLKVASTEKGVSLDIVGNASRNRLSFERWFEDMREDAEEVFKN